MPPANRTAVIRQRASLGHLQKDIAKQLGVAPSTVCRRLMKDAPFVERYRELNEEGLKAGWGWAAENTLEAMYEGASSSSLTAAERQRLMISLAIATEKQLLVHGRPTALVENVHELRISLGEVATKLLRVGLISNASARVTQEVKEGDGLAALPAPAEAPPVVLDAIPSPRVRRK